MGLKRCLRYQGEYLGRPAGVAYSSPESALRQQAAWRSVLWSDPPRSFPARQSPPDESRRKFFGPQRLGQAVQAVLDCGCTSLSADVFLHEEIDCPTHGWPFGTPPLRLAELPRSCFAASFPSHSATGSRPRPAFRPPRARNGPRLSEREPPMLQPGCDTFTWRPDAVVICANGGRVDWVGYIRTRRR